MTSVRHFNAIPLAEWPREAIYRRLGFRRASTRMTPGQQQETERYIEDAIGLIHLRGAAGRLDVRIESPDRVVLAGDLILVSRNLAEFLAGCREVVLMGATAGSEIMEAIAGDMASDRVTRAVVLDAAASEIVDAALDWIMSYLNQTLRREGKALKKTRYSAGYGDLPLENQRVMHQLLDMGRLGVTITDSCLLVPEKSVTAITGIIATH